jgi:hypothetical protein
MQIILRQGNNCHYNALVAADWWRTPPRATGSLSTACVVPLDDAAAALKRLRDARSGLVVAPAGQRKVGGWIAPVDELFRESVEMEAARAAAAK